MFVNIYSHQGWEAWNAVVTSHFFCQMKHGCTGKGKEKKTKLMLIERWIQRRVMWITDFADAMFENMSHQDRHATYDGTADIDEVLQQYLYV
jgi:hypothetical protein